MSKCKKFLYLLLVLVLVGGLAASLGIMAADREENKETLDNMYKMSYYSTLDSLSDAELKLSKLSVATSPTVQRDLLTDVRVDCELAAESLTMLSGKNGEIEKVIKFVNQLGDYSYFLAKKLPAETLTADEKQRMDDLYEITRKVYEAFVAAGESIELGGVQSELDAGGELLTALGELFNSTVDYPEMIYDGPFSDALITRDVKFLQGKDECTSEEAAAYLESLDSGKSIAYIGENAGTIASYLFGFGETGSIQVTKTGKYIVQYADTREVGEAAHDKDKCITVADALIASFGYEDMEAVWVAEARGIVYLNYAYVKGDVVFYPDLIKVKIAQDTAEPLGLDASGYIYNHVEREVPAGVINLEDAESAVSDKITVNSRRLTVIPTEWNTEIAAYEFAGEYNGHVYYVYVDAASGEEVKVMRVIEDEMQGALIN